VPHTLLLADDSVTIQRVIELTFADEDVRVIAVSTGDEAIATLNRTPPDIVLADVGMPGPSGYDIARHVKDTPALAHIPVVLLTGAFEPIDQSKAAEVGCDGVLAKPFEPQLVIGRVRELLARPKQAAAPAASGPPSPPAAEPPAPWSPPGAASGAPSQAASSPQSGAPDYFDRLDEAFANLNPERGKVAPPSGGSGIDWLGASGPDAGTPPQSLSDLPLADSALKTDLSDAGKPGETPATPPVTAASTPASGLPSAPTASPPPMPAPLPPLADAFAALLEAEQDAPSPTTAPTWPVGPAPVRLPPDLVDQVTRRVLDQLSDRVVRETVAELVSSVAERLVREEIERIKSNIK
jgi:CheY-like chemotaxis protein